MIKSNLISMSKFKIRARKEKTKRFITKLLMNRTSRTGATKRPPVFDTLSPLIERGQGKDS